MTPQQQEQLHQQRLQQATPGSIMPVATPPNDSSKPLLMCTPPLQYQTYTPPFNTGTGQGQGGAAGGQGATQQQQLAYGGQGGMADAGGMMAMRRWEGEGGS